MDAPLCPACSDLIPGGLCDSCSAHRDGTLGGAAGDAGRAAPARHAGTKGPQVSGTCARREGGELMPSRAGLPPLCRDRAGTAGGLPLPIREQNLSSCQPAGRATGRSVCLPPSCGLGSGGPGSHHIVAWLLGPLLRGLVFPSGRLSVPFQG